MSVEQIPMRWPKEWNDASKLELIKGTPINCLAGEAPPSFPLGDVAFVRLDPASPPQGVRIHEGVWPHVKMARAAQRDSAESGPTGAPWVDSNGWRTRLARELEPDKAVWLQYDPPKEDQVVTVDSYALAVAEASTYGARWVISLDDNFRKGLEARTDSAMAAWKKVVAALEFSQKHKEWWNWEPVAALGVVSDFTGENEFLGGEFLNLAARRHLAYRIIPKRQTASRSFAGLKAILYVDSGAPEGELRDKLLAFVNEGRLLISPVALSQAAVAESKLGYEIRRHGKGGIASPVESWSDPYLLAADVHLLLSHREDVLRIWNGGTMDCHYVASEDGKRAVVHLVSYSQRSTLESVTLGVDKPFGSAEFMTLQDSSSVKPVKRRLGTEVPLPPFQTYAAIELRG
jgi:hypothetical protein